MIGNTMLKKRLRVFANIASENEVEYNHLKHRESINDEIPFSNFNLDSFLKNSDSSFYYLPQDLDLRNINQMNDKTQDNAESLKDLKEDSQLVSNCLLLNFPFKISEENVYSVLIYYGEVESLIVTSKNHRGTE